MSIQQIEKVSDEWDAINIKFTNDLYDINQRLQSIALPPSFGLVGSTSEGTLLVAMQNSKEAFERLVDEKNKKISDYAIAKYETDQQILKFRATITDPNEQAKADEEQKQIDFEFGLSKSYTQDYNRQFDRIEEKFRAGNTAVNVSKSEEATIEKYENSEVVAASNSDQTTNETGVDNVRSNSTTDNIGRSKTVPPGAVPARPAPVGVNFRSLTGDEQPKDMRVKIRVPKNYLTELTKGPGNNTGVLGEFGGIIFPYTPQIGLEQKADYVSQHPIHSNFNQYFYQKSSVSPITISGKFSVANDNDAMVYIATLHLLRALTKMRSGGITGDSDSGAPPPVCRLDAYGTFMLQNIPIVISSFKLDLPETVDYYTVGKVSGTLANRLYEKTAVPIISSITVNCLPIYSRNEIQKFNVTQWLGEKYVRKAGYL